MACSGCRRRGPGIEMNAAVAPSLNIFRRASSAGLPSFFSSLTANPSGRRPSVFFCLSLPPTLSPILPSSRPRPPAIPPPRACLPRADSQRLLNLADSSRRIPLSTTNARTFPHNPPTSGYSPSSCVTGLTPPALVESPRVRSFSRGDLPWKLRPLPKAQLFISPLPSFIQDLFRRFNTKTPRLEAEHHLIPHSRLPTSLDPKPNEPVLVRSRPLLKTSRHTPLQTSYPALLPGRRSPCLPRRRHPRVALRLVDLQTFSHPPLALEGGHAQGRTPNTHLLPTLLRSRRLRARPRRLRSTHASRSRSWRRDAPKTRLRSAPEEGGEGGTRPSSCREREGTRDFLGGAGGGGGAVGQPLGRGVDFAACDASPDRVEFDFRVQFRRTLGNGSLC